MKEDVLEVSFLVQATRKTAETIRVVTGPVPRKPFCFVAACNNFCHNNCLSNLKRTSGMEADRMGVREGHEAGIEEVK